MRPVLAAVLSFALRAAALIVASLPSFACTAAHPTPPASRAPGPEEAPPNYDALCVAAQSAVDTGHAHGAVATAADAARLAPNRPEAYIIWGRALAQLDDLQGSSTQYERARSLGSREPALFAELGSVYDVAKRYTDAAAVYGDFLTDHPRDAAIRGELGLTLLLLQEPDKAIAELKEASRLRPQSLQLAQDLGYAQLSAKQFAAARDTLQNVTRRAPQSRDAWRFLAAAYRGLGDTAAAQKIDSHLGEASSVK